MPIKTPTKKKIFYELRTMNTNKRTLSKRSADKVAKMPSRGIFRLLRC